MTFKSTAKLILNDLGYSDWKVKIIKSGGGLCIHKSKELWLDKHLLNITWLLHEIAHIKHPNHSALWGDYFTFLVSKYWAQYDRPGR